MTKTKTVHFRTFLMSAHAVAYCYPHPPPSATNLTVAGPCHSAFEFSCVAEVQFAILTASLPGA